MVCKLIGDEDKLREDYMNYVENFISDKADDTHHYTFISSFLSHCLPLLDPDTDPALCHLISSLVSHGDMHGEIDNANGNSSDICDRRSSTATSLENVNMFASRHLLSNLSP